MKKQIFLLQACLVLFACSDSPRYDEPVVVPEVITKNLMSWLYYERDHMEWSADFEALDTSFRPMERREFLHKLTTGNYFPVKIKTNDSSLCYQLHRMGSNVDKDIREVLKGKAKIAYRFSQYEGSPLPDFKFVDLNGNVYNPQTTKGKIVVLNCWYIGCQACKEEMPELNKIVQQTANRNDVVFLGLAFDHADDLKKFLAKTRFDYKIVADKEDYLRNVLGIVYYPTHLIINKKGEIVKIIDGGINEFINALNKEFSK